MNKLKYIARWIPQIFLALPMIGAGSAKLAGVPELHQSFDVMGLPIWFGYFIGAAEVAGGIGLLIPRLSALAATGLIPIMLGAIFFHISFSIPSPAPAIVFLLLAVYTIYARRNAAIWYPLTRAAN